jgi:hypothetical protein
VDFEGELGVVIAKKCHKLTADEDVRPYILGYTCVNDVTARDLQSRDGQWTRAKGFDTFCPVGPVVTDELDPWAGVGVETRVNGTIRQHSSDRGLAPLAVALTSYREAPEYLSAAIAAALVVFITTLLGKWVLWTLRPDAGRVAV